MKRLILLFALLLIFPVGLHAEERIGFGYALVADGTCSQRQSTLTGEYDRENEGDGSGGSRAGSR